VPRADAIPRPLKALTRAVAARDIAVGGAVMFAPMTVPLVWALVIRIASYFFVAVGWGVLNLLALWTVAT
jgi:hypothetical protein